MEPADIPVTTVMDEEVVSVLPDTPLPEVFETFSRLGCTDLVVAGPEDHFLGFITALDLLASVGPVVGVRSRERERCIECLLRRETAVAADIMTRSHISVPTTATLRHAIEAMEHYRYPALVVVDERGVAVGRLEACMVISHLRVAGHL
ncbi:CBS domain-containing protein [Methanofollis aquaemaris]|uniref:CBS domain-containing protein n=1 Tax=Methanofollis aquaemaris TaxID=126734 RepID=A0A8A3S8L1_9EURY|nr:CBS domain-containing protein [Methanofollis aquaemaris]QSZ68031.1 CBS domain-containing protein [Methanofollis aquaemaris]